MKFSKTDVKLLEELQRDCRQSLKELSKKLRVPLSTIHGKIRKFEEAKIIRGYSALLDAEKLGESVTAFVLVQCGTGALEGEQSLKPQEVCRRIARFPFVLESHLTTGQYDIFLKLKGKSMRQIGNILMENVWKIPGVRSTQTVEAFYNAKETQAIDLSQLAQET